MKNNIKRQNESGLKNMDCFNLIFIYLEQTRKFMIYFKQYRMMELREELLII